MLSLTSNTLTLTINDPQSQNYPLEDLIISLDGQLCGSPTGTFTSLTCTLPTNTDGTPTIRAGDHYVKVMVENEGEILPSNAVTVISNPLTLTSLDQSTGTANGGFSVIINGKGFPSEQS